MSTQTPACHAPRGQTPDPEEQRSAHAAATSPAARGPFELRVIYGEVRARSLPWLAGSTLIAGRLPGCDVTIPHSTVSRRHCAFERDPDGAARIRDLGSRNQTTLNGKPVDVALVKPGDRVGVGAAEIEVLAAPGAPPTPPRGLPMPVAHTMPAGPPAPGSGPERADIPPGTSIGRFRLVERIGSGGFATIYRAVDTTVGREIALKVLHPLPGYADQMLVRFTAEAKSASQLGHPHIIRVHDAGQVNGLYFIAMELARGGNLAQILAKKGRLAEVEALRIGIAIASAVEHAAARGIIHRDVKPQNILFTETGEPKLADFGIAKNLKDTERIAVTRRGEALGSIPYLAPEQLYDAIDADCRADVYSIGATLWRSLAGRPPFEGTTATDWVKKILEERPPPLRTIRPDVSEATADALDRCLEKDRERRFLSPGELKDALRAALARLNDAETGEIDRKPRRKK